MLDIFSASGFFVHRPCGPRKSGMPESVEMPAPVRTTTRSAAFTQSQTTGTRSRFETKPSGHLDLAAAAEAAGAHGRDAALRHDDRGGRLAAQLLQLLHRALDRFLGERAELLRRLLERAGADLEADRQRARGRQHLRLADVEHRARLVTVAVLVDGRQAADRANAPVGEDFLEVKLLRIDPDVVGRFRFRSHKSIVSERIRSKARAMSTLTN